LADQFPVAASLFRAADEILERKLTEVAWNGPIEELTKTSNCQPALFVHGLACLAALREIAGEFPIEGAAGLSLGEMTAHAAAGTFDFATGLRLVQKRGELMDEACAATIGGMAAMIGAYENEVRQLAADEDADSDGDFGRARKSGSGHRRGQGIWYSTCHLAECGRRLSLAPDGFGLPATRSGPA
jgi:[acyl-carrier-protein] S-malonyltransferase